jgi:methionine--tRNA ligase beta chain
VMPRSVDKVWGFLGETEKPAEVRWDAIEFGGFGPGRKVGVPQALFPRVALKDFLGDEAGAPAAGPDAATAAGPETTTKGAKTMDLISYEEFRKMDLRVAQILEAERIPGATKILKLKIDIGTEQRQMIAGVAETYAPEELVGKKLIVICNLQPAVIRGIESQAMLLAAITPDNKALIPFFDRDIAAGALVK